MIALAAGQGVALVLMARGAEAIPAEPDKALEPESYPLHAAINHLLVDKLHEMLPVDGGAEGPGTVWRLSRPGGPHRIDALPGRRVARPFLRHERRRRAMDQSAHRRRHP